MIRIMPHPPNVKYFLLARDAEEELGNPVTVPFGVEITRVVVPLRNVVWTGEKTGTSVRPCIAVRGHNVDAR